MVLRAVWMMVALAVCTPAFGGVPRHIRILWSVQVPAGSPALPACALVLGLDDEFKLQIPESWPCLDGTATGAWKLVTDALVQPGDYVTVYAVNYNAISYKPATAVITTVKPEDPLPLALLLAAVQAGGFGKYTLQTEATFNLSKFPQGCLTTQGPATCLDSIGKAVEAVEALANHWNTTLAAPAAALAKERASLPAKYEVHSLPSDATPDFGIPDLESTACEFSAVDGTSSLGKPCKDYHVTTGWMPKVGTALGQGYSLMREFDTAKWTAVSAEEMQTRDRYRAALDEWLDYFTGNRQGVRSELAIGVSKLTEDLAAIKGYRAVLNPANRALHAVEIPRQGPVASLNRLVFALPLRGVGDPDTVPPKLSRTFEVRVAGRMPAVMPSAGIMVLSPSLLHFKTLALAQEPNGSGGLQRRLVIQNATDYRAVTSLAAVNFHIPWRSVYVTVATTADKQAFKSVLGGVGWYFPKFRSLVTASGMGAKGSRIADLEHLVGTYGNASGIVPDSLSLAQIPQRTRWHWTPTLVLTFTPF